MIGQITITKALPAFNNLGCSVIRIFFWWIIFSTDFLHLAKKMKKIYPLEV